MLLSIFICPRRELLTQEQDRVTADHILSLITDEEQRSDELKRQATTHRQLALAAAAADAVDMSGVAAEQAFNREQVQEQEQEQVRYPSISA